MKIYVITIISLLILSCNSKKDNTAAKESTYLKAINVENIDYDYSKFDTLSKADGQEYVDFSYRFLQTSKFKRHLNTIGIMIDTTNYEYIKRLSYSYKKAGEHQKAIQLLELSIEKETDYQEKLAHMGYAAWSYLYFYRDYLRTITLVDELLAKSNQDNGIACHGEPCLLIKGQALYRLKKYNKAIEAFTTYQEYQTSQDFSPMDNSLIVFYKARCLMEIGKFQKAKDYFLSLVEYYPHAEAFFQLAKIYSIQEDKINRDIYIKKTKDALDNGYSFKEPYFERFDKVFDHMINDL